MVYPFPEIHPLPGRVRGGQIPTGSGRRRPRSRFVLLVLPLLAGACAASPGPAGPTPAPRTVAEVVDSIVSASPLDRTHWGIEVYDPAARRVSYSLNPGLHFIPASNTKLVVAAVALGELGADYRYRTELFALGPEGEVGAAAGPSVGVKAGGGTQGARGGQGAPGTEAAEIARGSVRPAAPAEVDGLLLVARGDPTLSRRFHPEGPTPLEALADSVVAAGVRRVRGEVVIDLTYFDDQPVHPAWEVGDLTYQYAAPTAAFAVEEGTFRIVIEPGDTVGAPARVQPLAPPGAVRVQAAVTTEAAGARRRGRARRPYLSDIVEVTGAVPIDAAPDTLLLAAPYPEELAARELLAALTARGVVVEGGVRLVRSAAESAVLRGVALDSTLTAAAATPPAPAANRRLLATWHSPPLAEIVAAILKPSQNWIAEQLLKTLGAERGAGGSWAEGLKVERRYLVDVVRLDSTTLWLSDGSGLSAQNLLTPRAIVELLEFARRQPWGADYLQALAVPGEAGTLERRLSEFEGRLFAKTGTITHVNSLSGYIRTANGRDLIFSIMTNASGAPATAVRRAIDRVMRAIAVGAFQE